MGLIKTMSTDRWLRIFFPFLRWRSRISRRTLKQDLLAGLTGAVVVLPQGVAFATIAGMPPQYGLYAGMIPAIIAALFGSSWHLVSGPTTAASVVLFSALSAHAVPGSAEYVQLALTLTLMVGFFQLVMGLARMGALVNFISHTVVVAFTAGAALLILITQLKHFFGINIEQGSHAYETVWRIISHLHQLNPYVLVVALVTLLLAILVKRRWPSSPYMLVAMVAGSLLALLLNSWLGQDYTGITTLGALPATLPPLSSPSFSFHAIDTLFPAAVAMTLLALTEAVTIARSIAIHSGQNLDGNQEFIGQGLSNIVASFFSGYVATGSFNRSAVNFAAGARTPLSAIFAALLLMLIVLLIAPVTAFLPQAAMAGLLFQVAWGLIDFYHIRRIIRTSRAETAVLATTFLTTILIGLEVAILLGVVLGLSLFVMNSTRPRIYSRVPDRSLPHGAFNTMPGMIECPQMKILRLDGSLYFGSVHHIQRLLNIFQQREPRQKHLLMIGFSINQIDISGAEFLSQEANKRRAEGGGLYLYRTKEDINNFLRRGGYMKEIGEENRFLKKTQAISTIFNKLDHSICATCERRVFRECETVPRDSPEQSEENENVLQEKKDKVEATSADDKKTDKENNKEKPDAPGKEQAIADLL